MKKALVIVVIVLGALVVVGGALAAGAAIAGRISTNRANYPVSGNGMMNGNTNQNAAPGFGMMNPGSMGANPGLGMMNQGSANSAPLTVDQAYQAASSYLAALNNPDLKIAEVMVFSENSYVRVIEKSTGINAFELLVDSSDLAVSPEPGPNRMWNLKYGMMSNAQAGGMMGSYAPGASASMTVSSAQALQDGQAYLDKNYANTSVAPDADQFYGYYTIDIMKDGHTLGMLSVNGSTGQVWLHTWHGSFITSQDY